MTFEEFRAINLGRSHTEVMSEILGVNVSEIYLGEYTADVAVYLLQEKVRELNLIKGIENGEG